MGDLFHFRDLSRLQRLVTGTYILHADLLFLFIYLYRLYSGNGIFLSMTIVQVVRRLRSVYLCVANMFIHSLYSFIPRVSHLIVDLVNTFYILILSLLGFNPHTLILQTNFSATLES